MRFNEIESKLPFWLLDRFQDLRKWRGINWRYAQDSSSMKTNDGRQPASSLPVTEVFDSHLSYCRAATHPSDECVHMVMLDLDHNAFLADSSTPGHHHLYLSSVVTWKDYKELLELLGRMGIIESNYAGVSIARAGTSLRAPWVRKGHEKEDVVAAMEDYLAGAQKATTRMVAF